MKKTFWHWLIYCTAVALSIAFILLGALHENGPMVAIGAGSGTIGCIGGIWLLMRPAIVRRRTRSADNSGRQSSQSASPSLQELLKRFPPF